MRSRPSVRRTRAGWLLGASLGLLATGTALTDVHAQGSLRFKHLSRDEGLSESTAEAIVQDRRGFMWFGTADGLNRYDGYTFTVYHHDPDDPSSIGGDYIWDLLVDHEGVLWIGSTGGLNRYAEDTDSFVRYRHDPEDRTSLSDDNVTDVFEDRQGVLWVGTGLGLNRFDRSTGSFTHYRHDDRDPTSLSNDNVQVIYEDSRGRLWAGTEGGLNVFDEERMGFLHYRHDHNDAHSLDSSFIRSLLEDRLGQLWIGTEGGLNRLDPDAPGRFITYKSDARDQNGIQTSVVWTILEDRRGTLWIGTDRGGLAYFDRARDSFVHHTHDPRDEYSISSNVVSILYEDDHGDLWTGNYAGGVNLMDRAGAVFAHYRHHPDDSRTLNHSSVLSLLEDTSGRIWVGTEDGLAWFDRAGGGFVQYRHEPNNPASLSAPAVTSIFEDRDGVLWVGTYAGGLNRFDQQKNRFTHHFPFPDADPGAPNNHVNAIHSDREGCLWIGTYGGLYRRDGMAKTFAPYRNDSADPASLADDLVWDIHEDSQGRLWIGTHAGLALYDPDRDAFVNYRHDPQDTNSLSFDHVLSIFEDREERLWIGTQGGGLNLFDPEAQTFTAYRIEDGLPSDVIYSILEDQQGHIWLATNNGLSDFDVLTHTFHNYDKEDGLQGRQFNRNAAVKNRNGELFFGGIDGLNIFDPNSIQTNTLVPPVVITDFRLFNEPVAIGGDSPLQRHITEAETITLTHDQSALSFAFAALNYRSPEKNQYAFKLEGFDDDWVAAGATRTATYTNLDPGAYTFRVKGSNNSGLWNQRGASIQLIITPPFWATWWFRLLVLSSPATVLFVAFRVRTRGITARSEELQAINAELKEQIQERRRAVAAREQLLAELEGKNVALGAQNAELERFTYTVSHDLKSPLVTIRGFLGLLQKDARAGDSERMDRDIERITTATETMNRLLAELLELSRLGRVANPTQDVSLTELARDAVHAVAGRIAARGVSVEIDPAMPHVLADRVRLLEVFQNLVENAVAFMGTQAEPRLEIGSRPEDEAAPSFVRCFVRDNGLGIEPRYHEKVFGLFERLSLETAGTGIGLALVRRIVDVHGGRVWVESRGLGHGSTFWFTLPRTGAATEPPA